MVADSIGSAELPEIDDSEQLDHEYIGRMQQLGLMDHGGCWTDAGIKEALK